MSSRTLIVSISLTFQLLSINFLHSQEILGKPTYYKVWIKMNEDPYKIKGTLYNLYDSHIIVKDFRSIQANTTNIFPPKTIPIEQINSIKVREKNSVAVGILKGALLGFAAATFVTYIYYNESPEFWLERILVSVAAGVVGAIPGGIVGMFIGAIKIKIPINGNIDSYKTHRKKLCKYSTIP